MLVGPLLSEAFRAMAANRLRSALTMLGMIIGVGAVILMLSIGQGARDTVEAQISALGSNLLVILSGASSVNGLRSASGSDPTLTLQDVEAVRELPTINVVAPVVFGTEQVVFQGNNWSTPILGITPDYLRLRDWRIASGYAFGMAEVRNAGRVALIGQTAARQLFGSRDPLGQVIRIRRSPYTILGTLRAKGQSLDGRDQDDAVLVPITTAQRKLLGSQFQGSIRFMMAQARDSSKMAAAERDIGQLLRQRHRIREGMEDDFSVRNLSALADTAAQATRIMAAMLGAIASISLLVGGIGIMNIMLVSVTERTREIGIRMAIGAHRRDILAQFLMESVIVSVIGCCLGVVLGVGGAYAVNQVFGLPVVITAVSVAMAFLVAATVGIFFGWYPARKAAHLKPVEALRYQ